MRTLELFSGGGGLALGLEAAGFEPVGLVEWNKDACETLRRNRPNWNVVQGDISETKFEDFGHVDVVAGGPPCQPFSVGGKARGYDDHRDMFPHAVRAVRELRPMAFIFENVRGLLRPAFSNYVEYIRLQMCYPEFPVSKNASWDENLQRLQRHHTTSKKKEGALTYQVTINQADAANYGVPQRRHRVFFVGFRSDVDARWFFPKPTHSHDELIRSKFVTFDYWNDHEISRPGEIPVKHRGRVEKFAEELGLGTLRWKTVRDAIAGLGDPKEKKCPISNHIFQPGARSYPGHTGSRLDEPSKALKAGDHGVPGGENMLRHPNGRVRYFTIREAARIQTFPDEYEFAGAWTEIMRQLGNAVPVELAKAVAVSVRKHLEAHGRRSTIQPAR